MHTSWRKQANYLVWSQDYWTQEENMFVSVLLSSSVMSDSLQPHRLWPVTLLCPWNFPGQKAGVPFPPGDLPFLAISFSRGSSWPRDQTRVCCISYIGKLTPPLCDLRSPINICNEASTVPEKPLSIILHSVSPVVEIYQITFVFSHFTETNLTHCILLIQ